MRAGTAAGVNVSPIAALGVPTVLSCVNAVSRSMATLPLKLYQRIPDGGKQVATEHYLYPILHDAPSAELTSVRFRRAIFANAVLRGNGYALIVRNGLRQVAELRIIENKDIEPKREDASGKLYYHVNGKRVESENILHISGLTFNGAQGIAPTEAVRESIGLAIALQDHGSRFFANSSTPSVALEIPNAMSPEQLKTFAKMWDEQNSGNANAHKRSILWGGAKFGTISRPNNEQSQFVEAKIHQDKAICQAFGVPQIKAGITDAAHFNNVWQENQSFIDECLGGWAAEFEQSCNMRLLSADERKSYFVSFIFDGLLRGDPAARYAGHQIAIQNGIMSRNEVRSIENMNPVDGGDRYIIPMNMQLLGADGEPVAEKESEQSARSQSRPQAKP